MPRSWSIRSVSRGMTRTMRLSPLWYHVSRPRRDDRGSRTCKSWHAQPFGSMMTCTRILPHPKSRLIPAYAGGVGSCYLLAMIQRELHLLFIWHFEAADRTRSYVVDAVSAAVAAVSLLVIVAQPWLAATNPAPHRPEQLEFSETVSGNTSQSFETDRETIVSVFVGAPWYHRSDVKLVRQDRTDLELKQLGWDGDALYFPIDGGARVVRWSGSFGTMIDFVHNKAVARLGRGAHGRKIENGIIETVETRGTLRGETAPATLRLTDLFERLEFTHGHNVLLFTGMMRLLPFAPSIRPYVGIGAGFAIPHVEIGMHDKPGRQRTNEYQLAGPAAQFVAGIEFRHGRGSFFLEYKYIWASVSATLSGDRSFSFKNMESLKHLPRWLLEPFSGLMEMPGDLMRQFKRWLAGTKLQGLLSTQLSAHQFVAGAGYVWRTSPMSVTTPDGAFDR